MQLQYAKENAADFIPDGKAAAPATFKDVLKHNPVATTHSLIQGVSLSSTPFVYTLLIC